MLGQPFYHARIRKAVSTFGALFNNLYVVRRDASGAVLNQQKVPLAYGPREKYLERIREQPNLDLDTKTAIKLPRMSFEIVNIQYDAQRQIPKTQQFRARNSEDGNRQIFYSGIPYVLNFQLNILAKSQDDALQIVEQIIPYFTPQYGLTIRPFQEYPDITEDVPLTVNAVTMTNDYEGSLDNRNTIIYTLDFEMKIMFYGPIGPANIIRKATTNFYLLGTGGDSDTPVSRVVTTPDPLDVSPDSDYGFTEVWTDFIANGQLDSA
jgi:hypothetical protein